MYTYMHIIKHTRKTRQKTYVDMLVFSECVFTPPSGDCVCMHTYIRACTHKKNTPVKLDNNTEVDMLVFSDCVPELPSGDCEGLNGFSSGRPSPLRIRC